MIFDTYALPKDLNPNVRKSLVFPCLWSRITLAWGLSAHAKIELSLWLLLLHDHLKETPEKLDLFFHSLSLWILEGWERKQGGGGRHIVGEK